MFKLPEVYKDLGYEEIYIGVSEKIIKDKSFFYRAERVSPFSVLITITSITEDELGMHKMLGWKLYSGSSKEKIIEVEEMLMKAMEKSINKD